MEDNTTSLHPQLEYQISRFEEPSCFSIRYKSRFDFDRRKVIFIENIVIWVTQSIMKRAAINCKNITIVRRGINTHFSAYKRILQENVFLVH